MPGVSDTPGRPRGRQGALPGVGTTPLRARATAYLTSARNFVPYWSQVISTAAQRATAAEILNRVREEVATRNAMSMLGA